MAASQEYQDLMQSILTRVMRPESRKAVLPCHGVRPLYQPSSFEKSFPGFLLACFRWTQTFVSSFIRQQQREVTPLHPTVQLIQSQMLVLSPFATMAPQPLSEVAVGVQIPSWLVGSEEACHIAEAATRTFGRLVRLETSPSSAYTAANYELCRISYDAFECTGPGRLMTLEYDEGLATASVVETPVSNWDPNSITFSAQYGLETEDMADWINSFIKSEKPDKLMLVGAGAADPLFLKAVNGSLASLYLEDHSALPPSQLLASGVAQAAKDALESQPDDCGEPVECEALRRRADTIAGAYRAARFATNLAGCWTSPLRAMILL